MSERNDRGVSTNKAQAERRGDLLACRHRGTPGTFDESARRLSHEELAVARVLVQEGHHVRSQAERRGVRTADLAACGTQVEVKSFQRRQDWARPASPVAVANKFLDARGQGRVAVVWAKGSGLSQAAARAGFALFTQVAARQGAGRVSSARIIGDGYDLAFRVDPKLVAGAQRAAEAPRHRPGQPGPTDRPVPRRGRRTPKMSP